MIRSPSSAGDADLVAACRAGEEGAWDAVVERHAPLLWAIARRSGLDPEEAADLVQTVFMIAWRGLDLLERPGALGGWLAAVARREAWRVSRRRRAESGPDAAVEEVAHPGPLPDAELDRLERAALLDRAIERLDDRCRDLLRLLFYREPAPSYAEAAAELGMPIGGIGPTRGRCLEKLRRILEALAPDVSAAASPASDEGKR